MKTPANGFPNVLEEGEGYMPYILPTLLSDDDDEQRPTASVGDPIQYGNRREAIDVVLLGWCGVVGHRMPPGVGEVLGRG